jgi:hypothetical protein
VNTTGLDAEVDDSTHNGGAGNSFVNGAGATDNTCSTTDCHDPSNAGTLADWDTGTASDCTFCHGDPPSTGSHGPHDAAANTFGVTIGCTACHPNNVANTHFVSGGVPNGAVQINGTAITSQYTGELNLPSTAYGTCGTNDCHEDGSGNAPAVGYTWGTVPGGADCALCHSDSPTGSGAHNTHLGTVAYGPDPSGSTDCGECHAANANNTSMNGQASHIDGGVDFASATTLGSTTACDLCHGGSVSTAAEAKVRWSAPSRVSCESCHGDYNAAAIAGTVAPVRAAAVFDSAGHGKVTGTGSVCVDCHDESSNHISGTLGDANRLDVVSGNNYGTSPDAFCSDSCHASPFPVHYTNAQTTGGSSDNGDSCSICHDPHGQSGFDAMFVSVVGSPAKTVSGFADKSQRSSYFVTTPGPGDYGVCQVCHDPGEVLHFNQSLSEDSTHNYNGGQVCTSCHAHDNATAFEGIGDACNACHGNPPASGAHSVHNQVAVQDSSEDRSDCAYCHTGADSYTYSPSVDQSGGLNHSNRSDRLASLSATVGYAGTTDDNCTSACHSSSAGGDGIWNDADGLSCTACHGNPPSGTNHSVHVSTVGLGCDDCHTGVESAGTSPLNHNDAADTTTDALWILTQGNAYVNTTGLDAEVDDSTHNGGAGNSFVNDDGLSRSF